MLRWANKHDKDIIALFMIAASGGICDYVLEDALIPRHKLLALELMRSNSALSLPNCLLVENEQSVIGLLCCYDLSDFLPQISLITDDNKRRALASFYQIKPMKNALYIDTIYIDTQYRHRGIGKWLLSHVSVFLERGMYKTIALYVWENNTIALSFYQLIGFKIVADKKSVDPNFPIPYKRYFMTMPIVQFNCFAKKNKNGIQLD